jgi:hypothetical protein
MTVRLAFPREHLAALCRKWRVRELALLGDAAP